MNEFLATFAVQSALVVGAAAILVLLLQHRSAETRNLVWRGALATTFLLPLLGLIVPPIRLPERRPLVTSAPEASHARNQRVVFAQDPRPMIQGSISASPVPEIPFGTILTVGYLLGCLVLAVRWILSWRRVVSIARQSRLEDDLEDARFKVLVSDDSPLHAPVTFGARNPVILLPAGASEWDEARWRAVILHESAHIRRSDWVWQCLGDLAVLLQWFNPLVWALSSELRKTAEEVADDEALGAGIVPSAYARELLSFVSLRRLQGVGMARRVNVDQRVRRVLSASVDRRRPELRMAVTLFGLMGVAGLAAAGLRFNQPPEPGRPERFGLKRQTSGTVAEQKSPDGVSVRISYLFRRNGSRVERWRPDGSPTSTADTTKVSRDFEQNSDEKMVWIVLDVKGTSQGLDQVLKGDFSRWSQIFDAPPNSDGGHSVICFSHPPVSGDQLLTGTVGIAYGPWKVVGTGKLGLGELQASAKNQIVASHGIYDPENHRPTVVNTYDPTKTEVQVTIPRQYEGDDLQLRVIDKGGRMHYSHEGSTGSTFPPNSGTGYRTYDYEFGDPGSIDHVQLVDRPYTKFLFQGIHGAP